MSTVEVAPVFQRRVRYIQLPLEFGPPIRQVFELDLRADQNAIKETVINFFVSRFLREAFLLEPDSTNEALYEEVDKDVLRIINDEFKYALKNLDSDINKAKEKFGLPSESSRGAVYTKELEKSIHGLMHTIVNGKYNEYKIPKNAENKEDVYEDIKEAAGLCLKKRTRKFGEPESLQTAHEVLKNTIDTNIKASVIPHIHGWDPEFSKIRIYTPESHPAVRMPIRQMISNGLICVFGKDFGFLDLWYK